jgi:hypothetical protein
MSCYTAVRVIDDPAQTESLVGQGSEFWPDKYTCVSCTASCEAIAEHDADPEALARMKVRDLTAAELYAALLGLGTPDEMVCDGTTVRELFATKPVKRVHGKDLPNTTRFLLETIELEDGTKLHFGAGAQGAIVYRITRPVSYTKKVLADV